MSLTISTKTDSMYAAEEYASFWEHVSVLRTILLRVMLIIGVGVAVSFYFHGSIIALLTSPLTRAVFHQGVGDNHPVRVDNYSLSNTSGSTRNFTLPKEHAMILHSSSGVVLDGDGGYLIPVGGRIIYAVPQQGPAQLVVLGPVEGMLIALKTSLWMGIVATSPLWLWLGLRFVLPALTTQEKRLIIPFSLLSLGFIFLGGAFAFFLTIPLANSYLAAFNSEIGVNFWSLAHYLDYTLFLLLANAIAFEFCAVGLMAVHAGFVDAEWLTRKRRTAMLLAFIISALLTPPDVLTQLMLAVPLIALYELIIIHARLKATRPSQTNLVNSASKQGNYKPS